ncbi:MAG TPA: hypothetical protein VFQ40_07730, partial [Actinomycetota bacterium]|nr:hypothetical protein [Actinomycetota bacterium]
DPISLATQIREGRYEPLVAVRAGIDPALVAVVERAMRRDPSERFASAGAMAAALSGEEATAHVEPPTVSASAPRRGADATATVELPRLEQTARLPAQPASTGVGASPPTPARRGLAVAAVAVTIVLVTILAVVAFSGGPTPAPGGSGSSGLPTRLEDALRRLEESVQP